MDMPHQTAIAKCDTFGILMFQKSWDFLARIKDCFIVPQTKSTSHL